jgi:hypothetical protein
MTAGSNRETRRLKVTHRDHSGMSAAGKGGGGRPPPCRALLRAAVARCRSGVRRPQEGGASTPRLGDARTMAPGPVPLYPFA